MLELTRKQRRRIVQGLPQGFSTIRAEGKKPISDTSHQQNEQWRWKEQRFFKKPKLGTYKLWKKRRATSHKGKTLYLIGGGGVVSRGDRRYNKFPGMQKSLHRLFSSHKTVYLSPSPKNLLLPPWNSFGIYHLLTLLLSMQSPRDCS